MKIIFFGTPYYVLPICEALHKVYDHGREKQLIAVVTQPPKQSGRDKKLIRSEVDHWAFKQKIPIFFDFVQLPQADLGICASYGQIIPDVVLKKFSHGIINIHPSLLPKYRGASPVQAAIANGEQTTGVTIFKMDAKMDHGEIISSFKEEILDDDTTQSLRDRLFQRSAQFLIDLLPNYLNGKIKPKEQNHDEATFTRIITKQDGFIKPDLVNKIINSKKSDIQLELPFIPEQKIPLNSNSLHNLIRAMNPWPGAWTYVDIGSQSKKFTFLTDSAKAEALEENKFHSGERNKKRLKILKSHLEEEKLVMDEVQLEGKNPVSWEQFQQGYPDLSFNSK